MNLASGGGDGRLRKFTAMPSSASVELGEVTKLGRAVNGHDWYCSCNLETSFGRSSTRTSLNTGPPPSFGRPYYCVLFRTYKKAGFRFLRIFSKTAAGNPHEKKPLH